MMGLRGIGRRFVVMLRYYTWKKYIVCCLQFIPSRGFSLDAEFCVNDECILGVVITEFICYKLIIYY